jgi:hypothetical protein
MIRTRVAGAAPLLAAVIWLGAGAGVAQAQDDSVEVIVWQADAAKQRLSVRGFFDLVKRTAGLSAASISHISRAATHSP